MATYFLGVGYDSMHTTIFKAEADNVLEAVKKVLRHYLANDYCALANDVRVLLKNEEAAQIKEFDISREDLGEICSQKGVFDEEELDADFDTENEDFDTENEYGLEEQEKIENPEKFPPFYLNQLICREKTHPKFTVVDVWNGYEESLAYEEQLLEEDGEYEDEDEDGSED